MTEEKRVMVLSPITDRSWVEGNIQVTASCGHECWLAPGSRKLYHSGVDTMCVPCFGGYEALRDQFLSGKTKIADPEEARRELKKLLRGGQDG